MLKGYLFHVTYGYSILSQNNITDGQIVMVNSMSGHRVPPGTLRFYSATKFAVTGLVEGWRQEVNYSKFLIR